MLISLCLPCMAWSLGCGVAAAQAAPPASTSDISDRQRAAERILADRVNLTEQGRPVEDFVARRQRLVRESGSFLATHADGPWAAEVASARLESLYLLAVHEGTSWDSLEQEARRIVNSSTAGRLHEQAAYRLAQLEIQRALRDGATGSELAARRKELFAAYVDQYPSSAFTPMLLTSLIDAALAADDLPAAREYQNRLVRDFPSHAASRHPPTELAVAEYLGRPFIEQFTALDGRRVDAAIEGRVALVVFWASWSRSSAQWLTRVVDWRHRFHKQGLEVIGISLDGDRTELENYVKEHDLPWPQCFDGQGYGGAAAMKFGVRALPFTLLIDRKGILRTATGDTELDGLIRQLLDER